MAKESSFAIEKNMVIIFGVTLIAVMGISSITPAFPGIIRYFGISTHQVGWLIAAFTLPGIFLTPVTGILADRFGRKLVLVPALFVFGIAGFLCSFMRDFHSLLTLLFIEENWSCWTFEHKHYPDWRFVYGRKANDPDGL